MTRVGSKNGIHLRGFVLEDYPAINVRFLGLEGRVGMEVDEVGDVFV